MKKLRSDARWHTFTADQQKQIQQWLFDDHLGYQQTRERMKAELGIVLPLSSIAHLYHYLKDLREENTFLNAHDLAASMTESGVDHEKMQSASKMLLNLRVFNQISGPVSVKEVVALGRLMLNTESKEIERARMELALEKLKLIADEKYAALEQNSRAQANLSVRK